MKDELHTVYIGGYTDHILRCGFDLRSGKIVRESRHKSLPNPSFLVAHPTLPIVYAAIETTAEASGAGFVQAMRVCENGDLETLGTVGTGGAGTCHLAIDPTSRFLVTCDYLGGTVSVISLYDDGRLGELAACIRHQGSGPRPDRQLGPHPHGTAFAMDRTSFYVCDLGTDEVLMHSLADYDLGICAARLAPGSGPRHIHLDFVSERAYLVNELANTVSVLTPAATRQGELKVLQEISTLPNDFTEPSIAAEIAVHPTGQYVYVSNRGHDSLAIFRRSKADGTLEAGPHVWTGGTTPRHFTIHRSGRWLIVANYGSDTVCVHKIDQKTGLLSPSNNAAVTRAPSCVLVAPKHFCR